jgi:hypothetical protein
MKWLDPILSALFSPLLVLGLYFPVLLPLVGWIFKGLLRRDAATWPDRGAWADHFVASLLESLGDDKGSEANLRVNPQQYRRNALLFFRSRLPWIVPPELLHEVYRRLLHHIDRRVSFFEQARTPTNRSPDAIGQPVAGNKVAPSTNPSGDEDKIGPHANLPGDNDKTRGSS